MKQFRETGKKIFICEECGLISSRRGLMNHISRKHNSQKYYDKWIKEKEEGTCKICKKQTAYIAISSGYKNCCSSKCSKEYNTLRTKEEIIKKYGVENIFQDKKIKEKIKNTKKERYGDENYLNREKAKETSLRNNGCEWGLANKDIHKQGQITMEKLYGEKPLQHPEIRKKKKETSLKRYGVESPNQSNKVKENKKKSCLEKYGVENPMQDKNIFVKNQKSGFRAKKYKNVYYRGSYELDFLEKFYDKIDIENGPSVSYLFKGKNKVYHSDFYIPSKNLVIEIKSSYYFNRFSDQNKIKQKSIKNKGFKYIKILDKDYSEFKKLF